MSLERLRPTIATITFDGSTRYEGARLVKNTDTVVRDIQNIHDSSLSPITLKIDRLNVPPATLELEANPHGIAQAAFHANVAVNEGDVHVWLPEPSRPSQKAGLAALHLYGQLAEGRSLVTQISTLEDSPETADRFAHQALKDFDTLDIEAFLAQPPPAADSLENNFMVSPTMIGPNRLGSAMTLDNGAGWTLPEALRQVQAGYDSLYPELGSAATSVVVAGIVSTSSLEVFEHAWDSAANYYNPTRPHDASRALLESGAFLLGFDES